MTNHPDINEGQNTRSVSYASCPNWAISHCLAALTKHATWKSSRTRHTGHSNIALHLCKALMVRYEKYVEESSGPSANITATPVGLAPGVSGLSIFRLWTLLVDKQASNSLPFLHGQKTSPFRGVSWSKRGRHFSIGFGGKARGRSARSSCRREERVKRTRWKHMSMHVSFSDTARSIVITRVHAKHRSLHACCMLAYTKIFRLLIEIIISSKSETYRTACKANTVTWNIHAVFRAIDSIY